jgi:hypothetical protein
MRSPITNTAERPPALATDEQAAWMVIAPAEKLSDELSDQVARSRYADAARLMRHTVRTRWSEGGALRAASPTFIDAGGRSHTLLEAVARFRDDAETGVRAAMMCFLAFEWRPAA